MERSDANLVESACNGDVACFRVLYERHYRMAVGIARSRLSDVHLAEDAAQEAFATACRRLASLRDRRRFPEWLGTICRRTASSMARAQKHYVPMIEQVASSSHDGAGEETNVRVRKAICRLSASGREVIVLHYFSGLSHEEIGKALGITPQSVHGRLQRARRQLGQELSIQDE